MTVLHRAWIGSAVLLLLAGLVPVRAEEEPADEKQMPVDVEGAVVRADAERIAKAARDAIAVVSFEGRDGERLGLGTGFVISEDGLIATNLHVIGQARPIKVKFADGREYDVQSVHASQKSVDLAILKVDAEDLPALELADSSSVEPGRPIVVMGNPLGLEHSVVAGVVSKKEEVDGVPMLQVAVPIEQGNSGGPVLDADGKVLGVVTLKSLRTRNLGYAVEANALKPLLESPNPVSMDRWLTIGRLDEDRWEPLKGATWRQRAGRILVSGKGGGFGGRALCLRKDDPPDVPFELAVKVKLDDESGAAGLVFHSNGGDKHYGFYPSGGQLRLSRFDGPDVFSWQVLHQIATPHYRPGEWNTLRLRIEKDRVLGFVNGRQVVESKDTQYVSGRVGLAKFRDTEAEFRRFRVGKEVPSEWPEPEVAERVDELVADIAPHRPPRGELVQRLGEEPPTAATRLEVRARELEQQAKRLRQLAREVHQQRVLKELAQVFEAEEGQVDLARAALLLGALDNADIDVDAYLERIDRMAEDVRKSLQEDATEQDRLAALDAYLFEQNGFHGSRTNYYHSSNSYLNEVLDDREGLPITLSLLYMELARRLEVNVVGVGLPGHFVVRHEPDEGLPQLIDVYDKGKRLSKPDAIARVTSITGEPPEEDVFRAVTARQVVVRMLQNLLNVQRRKLTEENGEEVAERMLPYVNATLLLAPDAADQRFFRAVLRFNTARYEEAFEDTTRLLNEQPPGIDVSRVRGLHRILEQQLDGAE